jgi:general secretion pathway protein L
MSRKILSLDIQSDSIAAVLLRTTLKSRHIEAYAYVPLTDQDKLEDGLASVLDILSETSDLAGASCIAAYPADAVSYRNIRVPFKEPKKIRQILPFELESELPLPIDSQLIDFQPVRFPGAPSNQAATDLMVASVETAALESYLDLLAGYKIDPDIISISSLATALWVNNQEKKQEKNWILADIGRNRCTVLVIAQGRVCYVRSFLFNAEDDASEKRLGNDIRRTVCALEEVFHSAYDPDFVLLTGDGTRSLNDTSEKFETTLHELLKVPVRRLDMADEADIGVKRLPGRSWFSEQMDNALSLALIETEGIKTVNLRQGALAAKKFWAENKTSLFKTGFFSGLVLILILMNFGVEFYDMQARDKKLDKQIHAIFQETFPDDEAVKAGTEKAGTEKDRQRQMWLKVEELKKNSFFPEDAGENIRTIDFFNEISRVISQKTDVKITRLVIGHDGVSLNGNTNDFNAVDDMKNRLEGSKFFKKITISSANTDKSGKRVRFKLKMQRGSE